MQSLASPTRLARARLPSCRIAKCRLSAVNCQAKPSQLSYHDNCHAMPIAMPRHAMVYDRRYLLQGHHRFTRAQRQRVLDLTWLDWPDLAASRKQTTRATNSRNGVERSGRPPISTDPSSHDESCPARARQAKRNDQGGEPYHRPPVEPSSSAMQANRQEADNDGPAAETGAKVWSSGAWAWHWDRDAVGQPVSRWRRPTRREERGGAGVT